MDPKSYLEFLALQQGATVVITDSGGMQEETSFLGVPCLTLRENTERPITVSQGTNRLIGRDRSLLKTEIRRILAGDTKKASSIPLWDGHAADRIAQVDGSPDILLHSIARFFKFLPGEQKHAFLSQVSQRTS